jgi:hypothetical protein
MLRPPVSVCWMYLLPRTPIKPYLTNQKVHLQSPSYYTRLLTVAGMTEQEALRTMAVGCARRVTSVMHYCPESNILGRNVTFSQGCAAEMQAGCKPLINLLLATYLPRDTVRLTTLQR